MGFTQWGTGPLGLVAQVSPQTGFALQNGTPTIMTWTAPNDGRNHYVLLFAALHVTGTTTGGQITLTFTAPDGTVKAAIIFNNGPPAGYVPSSNGPCFIVEPNTTVTVAQAAALTTGTIILFGALWAS